MVDLNGIIDLAEIPLPEQQEDRLSSSQQEPQRQPEQRQRRQQVTPPPPPPPSASQPPTTRPRGVEEDERRMMEKVMGFSQFDTTKGKPVPGNNVGAVHVVKKRRYRQYMNRKGGFNRPLDKVA